MKKLLRRFGLYLIGKKFVYTHSHDDLETVILSDRELSEHARYGINQELKNEKIPFKLNEIMMQMLKEHKGSIEDGKCFLAADDFILGVNKEGKVKPIVDCNTPKTKKETIK